MTKASGLNYKTAGCLKIEFADFVFVTLRQSSTYCIMLSGNIII